MLYLQYTCFTIKAICSQQYITFQVPFKDVKRPFVRYKKVNQIYLIEMVSAISTVLLEINVMKNDRIFIFEVCNYIFFRTQEIFSRDFQKFCRISRKTTISVLQAKSATRPLCFTNMHRVNNGIISHSYMFLRSHIPGLTHYGSVDNLNLLRVVAKRHFFKII